jgi:transposase
VIGADPHKHSVTVEVVDERERVLHKGRYGTDKDGYRQMLAAAKRFEQRRWRATTASAGNLSICFADLHPEPTKHVLPGTVGASSPKVVSRRILDNVFITAIP